LAAVYEKSGEVREDFRDNYSALLDRKIPKKKYTQDYKVGVLLKSPPPSPLVHIPTTLLAPPSITTTTHTHTPAALSPQVHDQAMRDLVEDGKLALADAVCRKVEALEMLRTLELSLAPKLAAAAEAERLSRECAQLAADLAQAQANEAAADAEVTHLAGLLAQAGEAAEVQARELARLEVALEEEGALSRGLQDDLEEAKEQLIEGEGRRKAHCIAEAAELARVRAEGEAAAAGAAAAAAIAASEGERLARELAVCEARLGEARAALERSAGEVGRLTGELGAARAGFESATAECTRLRAEGGAREISWGSAVAGVTKSMEAAVEREREAREKCEMLRGERDAAREGEAHGKRELELARGVAAAKEEEVVVSRERASAAAGEAALAREEARGLHAELNELKGELRRERIKSGEDAQRVAVLSGKLLESEERGRALGEAEAAWKARGEGWKSRETELLAGRERAEASLAGLTQELRSWKETCLSSMTGGNTDVLGALGETRRELALLQVRARGLESAAAEAEKLREALFEGEMVRRKLHDTVQELRGCIRVMVRVRPTGGGGRGGGVPVGNNGGGSLTISPDGASLDILPPAVAVGSVKGGAPGAASGKPPKPLKFTFDHVFPPTAQQDSVFGEVSNLVQSALDGYNVCIFSYGQTGSGKTYTMMGGGESEDAAGLIPRSTHQIRANVARLEVQGWEYTVEASCLEIYNESLKDLLAQDHHHHSKDSSNITLKHTAAAVSKTTTSSTSTSPPLTVHGAPDTGTVEVPGLTRIPIPSQAPPSLVTDILARAISRRVTAATACNSQSSRSHTVFTLHLRGVHPGRGIVSQGSLSLVDLAGSERIAQSGATGDRKTEAAHINKSLTCLGSVFSALASGSPHVPFRNSKLTHLLAPALRRGGKTLMLVAVAPEEKSAGETLCSLKFAQCVAEVRLGAGTGGVKKPNITTLPSEGGSTTTTTAATGGGGGKQVQVTATGTVAAPPSLSTIPLPESSSVTASALDASGAMLASLLDVSYMSKPNNEGEEEEEEEEENGDGGVLSPEQLLRTTVTSSLLGGEISDDCDDDDGCGAAFPTDAEGSSLPLSKEDLDSVALLGRSSSGMPTVAAPVVPVAEGFKARGAKSAATAAASRPPPQSLSLSAIPLGAGSGKRGFNATASGASKATAGFSGSSSSCDPSSKKFKR